MTKPVCLITGASGKLGTALTSRLASTHVTVLAFNLREPTSFSQLKRRIVQQSDSLEEPFAIQANLRNPNDIRRLVEVTLARYGRIDVLINAAADTKFHGKLLDLAYTDNSESGQFDINCVQPMRLVSYIYHESWKHDPTENARMNRCVVNISSISGLYALDSVGQAFYGASKAALNHLTRYLANELSHYSVRVNVLCPSKFPDSVPTAKVLDAVVALINGHDTGKLVEISRSAF